MAGHGRSKFTFINLTHPDELKERSTLDQVRSSAMSNFGYMRRRKNERIAKDEIVFEVRTPESTAATSSAPLPRTIQSDVAEMLPYYKFTSDAEEIALCRDACKANEGHSAAIRSAWSSVAFFDEISFQSALSNAALFDEMLKSGLLVTEDTEQSLCFHSNALEMIHKRLDDPEQHTSDSLIGGICGVLTHDYILGDHGSWNRHVRGLLEMIGLRGGVETLNEQLYVTVSWADIVGSYSQDIVPHLPLPNTWSHITGPLPPQNSHISRLWMSGFLESCSWISIYETLSTLLSDPTKPPNTWIEPIVHNLLTLRPFEADPSHSRAAVIEEVCRLGTLLFLAPIWRSFGTHPVRTFAFRQKILAILMKHFVEWGELRVLLLWTLAHAAREAEDENERGNLVLRLAMVVNLMELGDWADIVEQMKSVLWVDAPGDIWQFVRDGVEGLLQMRNVHSGRRSLSWIH